MISIVNLTQQTSNRMRWEFLFNVARRCVLRILGITFCLLSTCSAARNRHIDVFPSVSSVPLSHRLSALSFSISAIKWLISVRVEYRETGKKRHKKKGRRCHASNTIVRRLMANSYHRKIARSSFDTTVAETGYANEQLTRCFLGGGYRWP